MLPIVLEALGKNLSCILLIVSEYGFAEVPGGLRPLKPFDKFRPGSGVDFKSLDWWVRMKERFPLYRKVYVVGPRDNYGLFLHESRRELRLVLLC
jgi:hypothetical protein